MGEKNVLWNQLLKAKKAGDMDEVTRLEAEIEALKLAKAEERTGRKQYPKKKTYTVEGGDNWFSIAEEIYGDQRYAGLLMDANPGIDILQPGMVLETPAFAIPPGETPFFSYLTWGRVLKQNEALRAAGANPSGAHIGDYTPQDLANFFPNRDDFKWAIDIWKQENQPAPQENVPLMDGTFTLEDVLNALLDPTLWEEMGLEVAGEEPAAPEATEEGLPKEEPDYSTSPEAKKDWETIQETGEEEGEGTDVATGSAKVAKTMPEEEIPLTPEQQDAIELLTEWYNSQVEYYQKVSELNPEDLPQEPILTELDFAFTVYQRAIETGEMGIEELTPLISDGSSLYDYLKWTTLEDWEKMAGDSDLPEFVMDKLKGTGYTFEGNEINWDNIFILAGTGFIETRDVGIEAMGLVMQVLLNRMQHSRFEDNYKYDTIEGAGEQFAHAEGYEDMTLDYVNDLLGGGTLQADQKDLLDAAIDYAWRLMAGYALGNPTLFLTDEDAPWTVALPEGREVSDVLANVQLVADMQHVFEFNVHGSRVADETIMTPNGVIWELEQREFEDALNNLVIVIFGDRALVLVIAEGELVPNVRLDFQCAVGNHAVINDPAQGPSGGYVCTPGESGYLRYVNVNGEWCVARPGSPYYDYNWYWAPSDKNPTC